MLQHFDQTAVNYHWITNPAMITISYLLTARFLIDRLTVSNTYKNSRPLPGVKYEIHQAPRNFQATFSNVTVLSFKTL